MIKEIDAQQLAERMEESDDILVLDIRSDMEVAQGCLPQAQHLPMHLIPLKIQDPPKDKEVILYCRSGARSYHACSYLAQQGYDNAVNLRGGIIAWARSGLELVSAPAKAG
ncbi:MAG: rhodanese-like domain-containing protein [gamma proteobacterium symbiont of Bathyaustriella thionipta]|nr:rhodanese-like domain-containing protein [gamma proteobacterium symbiont of Bathyaustriella thionipta]